MSWNRRYRIGLAIISYIFDYWITSDSDNIVTDTGDTLIFKTEE